MINANNTLVTILQINDKILSKILKKDPHNKVKKDWVRLDTFIEQNRNGSKEQVHAYPHATLKISQNDKVPVNIYLDTVIAGMPDDIICDVITIQDLSKDKELSSAHFRHQLTNLPNQLQVHSMSFEMHL